MYKCYKCGRKSIIISNKLPPNTTNAIQVLKNVFETMFIDSFINCLSAKCECKANEFL